MQSKPLPPFLSINGIILIEGSMFMKIPGTSKLRLHLYQKYITLHCYENNIFKPGPLASLGPPTKLTLEESNVTSDLNI